MVPLGAWMVFRNGSMNHSLSNSVKTGKQNVSFACPREIWARLESSKGSWPSPAEAKKIELACPASNEAFSHDVGLFGEPIRPANSVALIMPAFLKKLFIISTWLQWDIRAKSDLRKLVDWFPANFDLIPFHGFWDCQVEIDSPICRWYNFR